MLDGAQSEVHRLVLERERHPRLNAVDSSAHSPGLGPASLGVDDPASGNHPTHVAWSNRLDRAEAIAMLNVPVEEIRDCCELDVRVRPNVDAGSSLKMGWAHVVDEDERADASTLHRRNRAPHPEHAEVVRSRFEQKLNRIGVDDLASGHQRGAHFGA
jgi:hypothetical protein